MAKPVVVLRNTKGSHLTFTELDANFQNLDDATITVSAGGVDVVNDLNGKTTLVNSDEITFTGDNTAKTVTVAEKIIRLYAYVHNAEGATINKGQPVYLYQATGDKPSVKLAYNTGDATSAKTLGLAAETLTTGADGYVLVQGKLVGVNTAAYNEGDTLYLGSTAGSLTATKPYAPNHLVYIGVVAKANAGQGEIYVRIQNGYELAEIHDVNINHNVPLANGHVLTYNSSNSLWENSAPVSTTFYANGTTSGAFKPNPANGQVQTVTLSANSNIDQFTGTYTAGSRVRLLITSSNLVTPITVTTTMLVPTEGQGQYLQANPTKSWTIDYGQKMSMEITYDGTNYWCQISTLYA